MARFNFINEDYDQDADPTDEQKSRENISISDSLDIVQDQTTLDNHLREIDEGIQSQNVLHEFKHVFDDEYHVPKEVEIAVAVATENLIELVGFKTPGINAIKNNEPGYKKSYKKYIRISTESVVSSIGDAIKAAFKKIVEMFRKLFNWITGKGDKEERSQKEDKKHEKVKKEEEKSKEQKDKIVEAVKNNEAPKENPKEQTKEDEEKKKVDKEYEEKHGRTPMQDLVHQIAVNKENPREVIKKMAEDIKKIKTGNGGLEVLSNNVSETNNFIKFVDLNFHHVLNRKLMKETQVDVEQLIVHGTYLDDFVHFTKVVSDIISEFISEIDTMALMETIKGLEESFTLPEEQFIEAVVLPKLNDEEFMNISPEANIYNQLLRRLNESQQFGYFCINREIKVLGAEFGPYKVRHVAVLKKPTEPPKIKFTVNVPTPPKDKVNNRSRWEDKIYKCTKESINHIDKIHVNIEKLENAITKIEAAYGNINISEENRSSDRGSAITNIINHEISSFMRAMDMVRTLIQNCEITHEFISYNLRRLMKTCDDFADVETIVI